MITFSPGPSQVYPEVKQYLANAFDEGILSISHRSETFNRMSEMVLSLIREKLAVPDGYTILYTSSATECWEIIAQSLTRSQSVHFHSGAFGEKWFQYAQAIHPAARSIEMPLNEALYVDYLDVRPADEVICLTQNETSNGTQVDFETIAAIRGAFPDKLIAYDCTSSMAGINLPLALGDVWFASVQKCFGLPAGLGILILSPAAMERAREINDISRYNALIIMEEHIRKFQTSCTPNVLGIYLLGSVLQQVDRIEAVDQQLRARMVAYEQLFANSEYKPLVYNEKIRSTTVLTIQTDAGRLEDLKQKAKSEGIQLGAGYGKWKKDTFRIANFPAHSAADVNLLIRFLKANL